MNKQLAKRKVIEAARNIHFVLAFLVFKKYLNIVFQNIPSTQITSSSMHEPISTESFEKKPILKKIVNSDRHLFFYCSLSLISSSGYQIVNLIFHMKKKLCSGTKTGRFLYISFWQDVFKGIKIPKSKLPLLEFWNSKFS